MNNHRSSSIPLFAITGIFILFWLYLTDRISGFLFCIFSTVLIVFAFTKNTTFLISAAIGMIFGYSACLVEKIIVASPMTGVLNLRTAEVIGDASHRLINAANEQTRQLKVQLWIKLISAFAAIITLATVLLKSHFSH